MDKNFSDIPKSLEIGIASSAYQIEGAWDIDDKSPSNWDTFSHNYPDKIAARVNGDVACDSYNKYADDIKWLKKGGFKFYRFSLSWSRILPAGSGTKTSKKGIDYYNRVIDKLIENNITPYLSIYHWDHPASLDDIGGWLNSTIVEKFANYARIAFQEFGDRVKFWTTINEPYSICTHAYGTGYFAPGLKLNEVGAYKCGHNILKAHARAYEIYDNEFRYKQHGKIGITNTCMNFFPINNNEIKSSKIAFEFNCGWFANPIFSKNGDYPKIMKKRIKLNSHYKGYKNSILPKFSFKWIRRIRNTSDYFGLNYYTAKMTENVELNNVTGWDDYSGVRLSNNESWTVGTHSWLNIVPHGLSSLLKLIKNKYDNKPIYILENGFPTDGSMQDDDRIDYLYLHMKQVLMAIKNYKCNVKAYTIWTLLDNFEWAGGFSSPFGLIYVNFTDPNRERIPRKSYQWLKTVLSQQKLIL
ncbi:hypothetical protein HCN44_001229 [Aphidius gifuensis]|uniref:Beta-glucosidase n=2 Tax=Aphidius gifuensis TaxID=684658 RepID=A0A834XMC6_APHGI|nr:hypothetical protein HCN44_001229 [Aphidius gifuensis]